MTNNQLGFAFLLVFLVFAPAACGTTGANVEGGNAEGNDGTDNNAGVIGGPDGTPIQAMLALKSPKSPWIQSAAWSGDGSTVAFATADGRLYRFDVASGDVVESAQIDDVEGLWLVPGAGYALGWGNSEPPRMFLTQDGSELLRFHNWGAEVAAASFNGELLLLGNSNTIGVWDLPKQAVMRKSGEKVQDFINRQMAEQELTLEAPPSSLDVMSNERFAVAFDGSAKGNLYVWNKSDPGALNFLGRTNDTVTQLRISPSGKNLVARNADGSVRVASTAKQGFEKWSIDLQANAVSWTGTGWLLTHDTDGVTHAYDIQGNEKWTQNTGSALSECWSRGDQLVCTDGEQLVFIDGQTGEVVANATAQEGAFLTYLSDGTHIGSGDATWLSMDPAAFAALEDPDAVKSSLGSWGK